MKQLFDAIKCRFDTDAPLVAAVTGLYLVSAPQNTAFPYIIYFPISSSGSSVFSGKSFDLRPIQFNIHTKGPSAVEACSIYDLLISRFDNCSMSMVDFSTVQMKRDADILLQDEERYWMYSVTYSIIVQQKS